MVARADEAHTQVVEVFQLALGDSVEQQLVPLDRPRIALGANGESLGVPVRNVEVGLLQREDVNELVLHHACPVQRMVHPRGAGHCDDRAGRGSDRLHPRQPDHAGTEPLMSVQPLRFVVNFDLRPALRLEAEQGRQFGIDLFEVLGHVPREQLVELGVGPDDEVLGRHRVVVVEHLQDLPHVADAHVIRIGFEGVVEDSFRIFDAARLHIDLTECRLRLRELRHQDDGLLEEWLGEGMLPEPIDLLAEGRQEIARLRIAGRHFDDDLFEARQLRRMGTLARPLFRRLVLRRSRLALW